MPASEPMRTTRPRAGFTLVEMMMAILLTMLVFAITVPFFRVQTNAVDVSAGRLDALQNARYAESYIDRELRLAGGAPGQPIIVQAAPYAISFNVDLVSRLTSDPNATYYNPTADSLATESWAPSRAKALPTAVKVYPAQFYNDANGNQSAAETISYFLYVDASSGRSDIFTLFRRVNDRDSTVVTRNLWIPTDTGYFFRYSRADSSGAIITIPSASLPVYWDAANHWADSIRIVDMRIAGLYRDVKQAKDVTRTVYHRVRLINAGMLQQQSCGSAPLGPVSVTATQVFDATPALTQINIAWTASLEEAAGERDVATYIVLRRLSALSDWETLGNIVATGAANYAFDDYNFQPGTWIYGVVSQDCSPRNSTVTVGSSVTNP
ncbi:MAG TPA: prepilin-type N-terminal cleavage/methylation domain-containing protein [Gemmatimonadaceae bacterium]|nr:prepilin-type N-terminal cleavage/methylation domain-containing protein [Gemmatimonadaceae bacterium]